MTIFQKVKDMLDDVRIAYTFSAYQDKARAQHMARAVSRFSTVELQADANKRMATHQAVADKNFVHPINELNRKAIRIQEVLHASGALLAIFERDYQQELSGLYASKAELIDACRSLNKAKSEAHEDLQSAVNDLNDWHARSTRAFFGNGGRGLPNQSIFGQSLGDRDSLKSDRDEAGSEIAACKSALAGKRLEIEKINNRIHQVKAHRQQMFDLREQGYNRHILNQAIFNGTGQMDDISGDIAQLQANLEEFITTAKHRTGTISIEAEIAKVCALRDAFILSFDTAHANTQRKALHRAEWLKKSREKKS